MDGHWPRFGHVRPVEGVDDLAFYAHPLFAFRFVSFGLTGASCGSNFLFGVVVDPQGWFSQGTFTLAGDLSCCGMVGLE